MSETRKHIERVITENPDIFSSSRTQEDGYVIMEALHEFRRKYTRFPDIRRSFCVITGLLLAPLIVYHRFPTVIDRFVLLDRDRGMIESYFGTILVSSIFLLIERIKIFHHNRQLEENTKAWMDSEGIQPNHTLDYLHLG